jgi:hypothetical protein
MIEKTAVMWIKSTADAVFVIIGRSGISGVKSNPLVYPLQVPTELVLTAAMDEFVVTLENSHNGGPAQTQLKNEKRLEIAPLFTQFCNYVTVTADGSLASLKLSGLPFQKPTHSSIGPLDPPYAPFLAYTKNSGELSGTSAPIYGALTYNWTLALASAPKVILQTKQTTGANALFVGLIPGEVYVVQLNAVGAAGPSDWSDVSSLMAT